MHSRGSTTDQTPKATDESRLLNMLPERLRAEVAVHVHLDSLKKVKIFEQCETGFLCELVLKLRSQVYSPGDYVCRAGETGREMFIINHGKVEVIVNNSTSAQPMVVAVLSEGNYFGEISLLRLEGVQNRRTADVRSIGYSELLCLSRRDLMAALVEYPEAKSILEDHAKKRMKTNLQAQKQFSVDTLLRNSQDNSSVDSGIVTKEEEKGQEVSEIKAMIEDLKNASRVPGRTIWQLIARCEVLQSKLLDKEKEVEDSKHRIKDLEQLLFSHHYSKCDDEELTDSITEESPETSPIKSLKPANINNRVVKQFSQDEGRGINQESPGNAMEDKDRIQNRSIPDFKITRPSSEESLCEDSERKYSLDSNTFIKTSKIHNIYERNVESKMDETLRSTSSERDLVKTENNGATECFTNFKICTQNFWDWKSGSSYCFSKETLIDQEFLLNNQEEMSLSTRVRDQFSISDSYPLSVPTIPEESEEDSTGMDGKTGASATNVESKMAPDSKTEYKHNESVNITQNQNELIQSTKNVDCLDHQDEEEDIDLINYRRLRLLSDCFLDDPNSRRNSWNNSDSEAYSDDDSEITSS